jgi:4-amino-4-deoxy-L-arabinose transferase-like glycosyltransferase
MEHPVPATRDLAAAPSPREARELALLLALVLGALGWLADKAFTIDDPLFLWIAEQILTDPLDPYGFSVNWNASLLPMHAVNQNPPLTGYFIATVAAVAGFDETALHLAFLVPAGLATAFTWLLARRFCARPLEAGAISLLTPASLVSASNVMCESWLLAFWCASAACWVAGFDRARFAWHAAAGLLAALAFLTKFSGAALVPLLFAYGLLREHRLGAWCLPLVLPVAAALAYELATASRYGIGHVSETLAFARWFGVSDQGVRPAQVLTGLAFAGGSLVPVISYAPLLWSRRTLAVGALAAACLVAGWPAVGAAIGAPFAGDAAPRHLAAQLLVFALAGAGVVALAVSDAVARRDADAALLALWLVGTLVFATFFNWVANARSLLPAAPVVGILIVRRLAVRPAPAGVARGWRALAPALAIGVALLVADADRRWANDVRRSADLLAREAGTVGETFFLGNWGLQYYLERGGALAVSRDRFPQAGDRLIVATNNTDVREPPPGRVRRVAEISGREPGLLRSMSRGVAGFYASPYGPLPWAVAAGSPDRYRVFELARPVRFPPSW